MAFISSIEDITKLHFTFFIPGNQFILSYPFYLIHIKISISFTYKHFEQELLSWKILDLNPIFYRSQVTLGRYFDPILGPDRQRSYWYNYKEASQVIVCLATREPILRDWIFCPTLHTDSVWSTYMYSKMDRSDV